MTETEPLHFSQQDIDDLSAFTSLAPAQCVERLRAYTLDEMAEEWRRTAPATPAEIRAFYASTELYLWELTKWHNTPQYTPYLNLLDTLIVTFPPSEYPNVLDYGCGIGTAAIRLLTAGYQLTIADVPGRTLDYARFRLRRRGYHFEVVEVADDLPGLPRSYDVLVCFDVMEHIHRPDRVMQHLTQALRAGGVAALITTFGAVDTHPHHLRENAETMPSIWPLVLSSCGLDPVGDNLHRKAGRATVVARRMRYWLWRVTGLYVQRLPRPWNDSGGRRSRAQ